jgi:hypothetical protein
VELERRLDPVELAAHLRRRFAPRAVRLAAERLQLTRNAGEPLDLGGKRGARVRRRAHAGAALIRRQRAGMWVQNGSDSM